MRVFIVFLFLGIHFSLLAQTVTTKTLKSEVVGVVLYTSGAEVQHLETVNLVAGRNLLVFEGLTPDMDEKSIRIATNEHIELLSISHKINHLTKVEESEKIKKLKDSVSLTEKKIGYLSNDLDVYKREKELILTNISLAGDNNGVQVSELKQAAEFYRIRLKELNDKTFETTGEILKQNEILQRLRNQLQELNAKYSYRRSEVSVLLSVTAAQNCEIELKYLVNKSGWIPFYDIRATEIGKPLKFTYRAKVFNNTEIDWKNIKVTLSTADPQKSITKPTIEPWYLGTGITISYSNTNNEADGYMQNQMFNAQSGLPTIFSASRAADFDTIEVPELAIIFEIKEKYTIPADAKKYIVNVKEMEVPALYKHFSIAKEDRDVFLLARILNWEDLNLIDGTVNIYFAGNYIGESNIVTRNLNDTLDISLGRDGKVLVTRTKMKEFSSTQFIGSKVKLSYSFELNVKNNRKVSIDLDIIDQVPISQNENIEVKIEEISNGTLNPTSGQLKWKVKLEAGESKKFVLSFTIKGPKEENNVRYNYKKQNRSQMRYRAK